MTLTRVALLDRSVEIPQGGPRFLKEATKETRERLKDLGLEPNFTRIFSASIVNLSGTELAGLKLINPLEIVISVYGIGVVSTRLKAVVKQVGSLEEFASGWSSLVKCSVDTMDGLLEAEQLTPAFSGLESLNIDLREASTLVKSRRFSFVHIVRGRPLEELPSDFLYSLTEPLFDRPISQTFALTHSKRLEGKVEGDEYFATPSGVVARLALEDSRRTNIRGTRKLLRRYVYAAIDYALALEAAVGNAGRIRSPETLRSVMLYLSPYLWSRRTLVWDAFFSSSYSRIADILGLFKAYDRLCGALTAAITPRVLPTVNSVVAAAGRLDFQPPVEGGLIPVTRDLDALILDILCLKDAIDAYLLSPDKAVDLLAAGLSALGLRELSDDQKKKLLRKLNDRVDWEGLSRPELEIITGISQRTLSRALERLERMGLVEPKKKERTGRRESKRGGVLVFKVVRPQVERFMKRHVSVVRLIFEGEG